MSSLDELATKDFISKDQLSILFSLKNVFEQVIDKAEMAWKKREIFRVKRERERE